MCKMKKKEVIFDIIPMQMHILKQKIAKTTKNKTFVIHKSGETTLSLFFLSRITMKQFLLYVHSVVRFTEL